MLALFGRGDRRLSKTLSLHVPSEFTPGPSDLLGLELEFSVRSRQGGRVHFGSLIHGLALEGSTLDPGDPTELRDRGILFARLHRYDRAIADLEAYLERSPNAADVKQIRDTVLRYLREARNL